MPASTASSWPYVSTFRMPTRRGSSPVSTSDRSERASTPTVDGHAISSVPARLRTVCPKDTGSSVRRRRHVQLERVGRRPRPRRRAPLTRASPSKRSRSAATFVGSGSSRCTDSAPAEASRQRTSRVRLQRRSPERWSSFERNAPSSVVSGLLAVEAHRRDRTSLLSALRASCR